MTELRPNGAPAPTDVATRDTSYDSAWNTWMNSWLDNERAVMIPWFEKMLGKFGGELLDLIGALELKLAKLDGAVDVLRGKEPPLPARFPMIKAWQHDVVFHEGEIVAFAGGCYQAAKDTARAPGTTDWICLAVAGNSLVVRGTYSSDAEYRCLDVAMVDGSSFVALKDYPGPCPGSDWQLLCSRGSRGERGLKGERGLIGPRGERGQAAVTIQSWQIDRALYIATPVMSDGSTGPPLELQGLFEQFIVERGE
jgi:hypothetical protein